MENASQRKKMLEIAFSVSSYWIVSILMVFLNKYLLSSPELQFDAPLFVTWFQCAFSLAIFVCMHMANVWSKPNKPPFADLNVDMNIFLKLFSLSMVFILMIMFNNLSLKYISVSFYMVVRSLSTVFNVVLVYFYFGEVTSSRALVCCSIITAGFMLGIDQEGNEDDAVKSKRLTFLGIFYGVLSSFFVAQNGVQIKRSIQIVEHNLWKLNYLINMWATIVFIPLIVIFDEHTKILSFHAFYTLNFWSAMFVSGLLSFLIGYVTSQQINVTSPLTHNISATTKSYVQTVIFVIVYNEVKTKLWWLSNVMVFVGAALYSYVRNTEMKQRQLKETIIVQPLLQTDEENI